MNTGVIALLFVAIAAVVSLLVWRKHRDPLAMLLLAPALVLSCWATLTVVLLVIDAFALV